MPRFRSDSDSSGITDDSSNGSRSGQIIDIPEEQYQDQVGSRPTQYSDHMTGDPWDQPTPPIQVASSHYELTPFHPTSQQSTQQKKSNTMADYDFYDSKVSYGKHYFTTPASIKNFNPSAPPLEDIQKLHEWYNHQQLITPEQKKWREEIQFGDGYNPMFNADELGEDQPSIDLYDQLNKARNNQLDGTGPLADDILRSLIGRGETNHAAVINNPRIYKQQARQGLAAGTEYNEFDIKLQETQLIRRIKGAIPIVNAFHSPIPPHQIQINSRSRQRFHVIFD